MYITSAAQNTLLIRSLTIVYFFKFEFCIWRKNLQTLTKVSHFAISTITKIILVVLVLPINNSH